MQVTLPLSQLFRRLWQHIGNRRRWQLLLLMLLMVLSSLAEVVSIGAVLPFLGVLTAPELVHNHAALQPFFRALDLTEPSQLLLPLTITFGLSALIAGAMRLILLWASTRLSFAAGADLSFSIYRRTLYQPYRVHCGRNSSEVITGISTKANSVIYSVIFPAVTIISSSIMLIVIIIFLINIDLLITILSFGGFGLIYFFIIILTRDQLLSDSQRVAFESNKVIKSLQEGLGGIRDVLIDGSQSIYCQIYSNADLPLRRAQGRSLFISQCPRYFVEALGMALIAGIAYFLSQKSNGITNSIPMLGALALGAQRLMPVLQQFYVSLSQIRANQASLQDTLELLDQCLPLYANKSSVQALPFLNSITLDQLSFQYSPNTQCVIRQLSLEIRKGSRVGFIGATGSGKSTLLDIIMGLLEPTSGKLKVDGIPIVSENHHAWYANIAHVPQTIFLTDGSIEENIAFGVQNDLIDLQLVHKAAQLAQIAEDIESWPLQYKTTVGERGVRLSGGQRQRIGIARALYKQANVIIFDEATSALDSETEKNVMQAIESLSKNLTMLIVSHRLTSLKYCTHIVELDESGIKRSVSYEKLVSESNEFLR